MLLRFMIVTSIKATTAMPHTILSVNNMWLPPPLANSFNNYPKSRD